MRFESCVSCCNISPSFICQRIRSIKQILDFRSWSSASGERVRRRRTTRKITRISKRLRGAAGAKYKHTLKIYTVRESIFSICTLRDELLLFHRDVVHTFFHLLFLSASRSLQKKKMSVMRREQFYHLSYHPSSTHSRTHTHLCTCV